MKQLERTLLTLLMGLLVANSVFARTPDAAADIAKVVTFRFLHGKDLFVLKGNEAELARLSFFVDEDRAEIAARCMPVRVDSYCASLSTEKENLRTAYLRTNQVKSELITKKGLTEADFISGDYTTVYKNDKDVVVVRIPIYSPVVPSEAKSYQTANTALAKNKGAKPIPKEKKPESRLVTNEDSSLSNLRVIGECERTEVGDIPNESRSAEGNRPYILSLRTNLLYDAFLLPTLGIEWRINPNIGIRLNGSLSWWGGPTNKVRKIWLLNTELRWYLLRDLRFYIGASGNYGPYNIYKYAIGRILSKDTGYRGAMWGGRYYRRFSTQSLATLLCRFQPRTGLYPFRLRHIRHDGRCAGVQRARLHQKLLGADTGRYHFYVDNRRK